MPFYLRFINLYYWGLTIMAFIVPINYPFYKYLPAFIIMWVGYLFFLFGTKKGSKKVITQLDQAYKPKKLDKMLFLFVCVILVFIPMYVKFYTGGLITSLVMGFASGTSSESNYQEYYRYFTENNIGELSLSKLPYIIGFGVVKLIYYFFFFCYVGFSKKQTKWNIFLIGIMAIMFLLVGISRGTNFESFELLVLVFFSMLVRSKIINNMDFLPKRQIAFCVLVIIIAGIFFLFSTALRSGGDVIRFGGGATSTFRTDMSHWSVSLMPTVSALSLAFSGYFTFGLYFSSELFWKIWVSSFAGLIGFLLPEGELLFSASGSFIEDVQTKGVDMGACWAPDSVSFISYLGFPLYMILLYNMGKYAARSYNKCIIRRDVGNCLMLFMIVYEMISFPVGNFLIVSSSNKIVLLSICAMVYFDKFKKYRFR